MRPRLFRRGMKQVLHEAELPVAPDERCLESFGFECAADARDDAQGSVELDGLGLAL